MSLIEQENKIGKNERKTPLILIETKFVTFVGGENNLTST